MGYPVLRSSALDLSAVGCLPLRVRHGQFETAISMLNRHAIRSGFRNMDALLSATPGLPRRGRYIMSELVSIAARINDCDEEELAASSVARVGACFELAGQSVLSGRLAIQGRVCVGCLRDDVAAAPPWTAEWAPFLRDWWQVAQIASCPIHLLPLVGSCDACRQPLDMRRPRAGRCRCGADLLAAVPAALPAKDVVADAYLLGRLERGPRIEIPLLDMLGFGSAAGLALNLGVSLDPSVPFNRTWNPGWHRARHASRGVDVLSGGWDAVDAALSVVRRISSEDRRTYKLVGRYGRLQHWLGFDDAGDLEPFRARLMDHARRHGAITGSTILFGERAPEGEWTTMDAARAIVGRHPGPISRMAGALGLSDQVTGSGRDDLIATRVVAQVKAAFERSIDSAEVKALLGCDKDQLSRYVSASIIHEFCPGGPTSSAFYERKEIERVAGRLLGGVPIVRAVPPGMMALTNANVAGRLGSQGVTRAIVDGRIQPLAVLVEDGGLRSVHNILVSRADVARMRREGGDQTFSVTEAGRLLRVHRVALGRLLPLLGLQNGRRLTADEVRGIRRRFASLREIAAARPDLGVYREIVASLRAGSILPILEGPWIPPLFERDAVERLIGPVPEELLPAELLTEETSKSLSGCYGKHDSR